MIMGSFKVGVRGSGTSQAVSAVGDLSSEVFD